MNQWLVSPAGGPFGPWPGVVEAGSGRVIAHVVPDEATAQELVNLRADLAAMTARADAAERERDELRAALAAATTRNKAAEKLRQIAAAKIQELMALADEYGRYCNSAGIEAAEPPTFTEWLTQQRAVQP